MKREGIKKGIYILPNLFTTANLFCGFFAIIRAINGDAVTAAWGILLAGIFDFLDGRVARFTKSQSEFGLEYDSLVDLGSFGLAPAVLIYTWSLYYFQKIGWVAAFVFFACGALRLARFNVQSSDVEKKSFQGLPIPAAAYCLATYVILYHNLFSEKPAQSYALLAMTVVLALLMVSNIHYRSFKVLDLNRKADFFVLVLLVGLVFVVASAPHAMLFVISTGYALFGIVEAVIKYPKKITSALSGLMKASDGAEDEGSEDNRSSLKVVGLNNERDRSRKEDLHDKD